jgi:hypothetical protein
MTDTIADPIKTYCFAGHAGDRAVVVMHDLRCPKCQGELTAESVSADLFGEIVVQCAACGCSFWRSASRGPSGFPWRLTALAPPGLLVARNIASHRRSAATAKPATVPLRRSRTRAILCARIVALKFAHSRLPAIRTLERPLKSSVHVVAVICHARSGARPATPRRPLNPIVESCLARLAPGFPEAHKCSGRRCRRLAPTTDVPAKTGNLGE